MNIYTLYLESGEKIKRKTKYCIRNLQQAKEIFGINNIVKIGLNHNLLNFLNPFIK